MAKEAGGLDMKTEGPLGLAGLTPFGAGGNGSRWTVMQNRSRVDPMPEMPERTLLAGCGKLGTRLGERLVEAGCEVFALRRETASLPPAFAALSVDLRRPLPHALPEVDAMVITLPPGRPEESGRPDDYLESLRNLAAALPGTPRRVVLVSSTRVFEGRTDRRALTEQDDPAPISARANTLLAGELVASELFDALVVRPAGIYGPGRELLLRTVVEGRPVDYARRTNRIHETDLVRALEKLLAVADPPALLHCVDQAPATLGDVVTFIAGRMGLRPPPRSDPGASGGTVLSGARNLDFLGWLEYPTFEAGYGQLIDERAGTTAAWE